MKRLLYLLLIPFLIFSSIMPALAVQSTSAKEMPSILEKHVFGVHGLSCPFCSIGIKKTFLKIKGVEKAEVDSKNGSVTVYTKKGICFSHQELKKIFNRSGFTYHGTAEQPKSCGPSK